jgi:protein-disulfide isomerase
MKKSVLAYVLCATGIGLSLASHYGLCSTDACVMYDKVKVYGLSVSLWGVVFFCALAAVEGFSRFKAAAWARTLMISGALGGEAILMYSQWAMGEYCAICLAVASVVVALAVLEAWRVFAKRKVPGSAARFALSRGGVVAAGLLAGLVLARPIPDIVVASDDFPRQELHSLLDTFPVLGSDDAWPMIRVYSDFLCPWCRKQEPIINEVLSQKLESLRIYFCDVPVHGKLSQFYITWFLACMLDDANTDRELVQAREMLFDYAEDKITDTAKILDSLKQAGITTTVVPEAIQAAYAAANKAADLEAILSTPTVVVEGKNGKRVILKSGFTAEELADAIENSR